MEFIGIWNSAYHFFVDFWVIEELTSPNEHRHLRLLIYLVFHFVLHPTQNWLGMFLSNLHKLASVKVALLKPKAEFALILSYVWSHPPFL
jgi:hypothetical protein